MKNMICIICPKGCALSVDDGSKRLTVTGNACPRGEKYAVDECTSPMRTVTAVMRVANREDTMASVKTDKPVPKDKVFEIMKIINSKNLTAPVEIGQIICHNIYGANIVATKNIK